MPDPHDDRWRRIERLYLQALERDAGTREEFLERACEGDDDLRQEVRSLLGFQGEADHFLERPALFEAARELAAEAPTLIGRRIGGYEILELIGAGGMGDVYRARDLRLERDIAVKVLDPLVAADEEYRRRFENEAKSASTLNHPNIVTIYAVGEEAGLAFITMELVRGRTLRACLPGLATDIGTAVDIAAQLAGALAAAHLVEIVHRDLKPENIMVTPDGRVKVLDFGIAKRRALAVASSVSERAKDPDRNSDVILGTVGYMSPEQARGLPVGPQSDQFSLGTILYEILAARRAFEGASTAETLAAIIDAQPEPLSRVNRAVPAELRRVIARCLEKRPEDRYHDAQDLERDLRQIQRDLNRGLTRRQWLAVCVAVAGAATGLTTWAVWPLPTLAVLPFVNAAKRDGVNYLCLGVTESLIGRIKYLPVSVKSMSLVSNFAGSAADPREFGRQVRASKVVTGSVAIDAGQLIVTVELIDIPTGARLWSGRYERARADIFKLWDEVATAIVDDGLHLRLTREERRKLLSRPTDSVNAFDFFLQARPFQMSNTEDDYLAARGLLQQAVDEDSRFAEAWVALAGTYWTSVLENYQQPTEAWSKVAQCLTQAAAIEPGLADLHFGRAIASFFGSWQWTAADQEWRRAWAAPDRDIQPELLLPYALARWALGDSRGALGIVRRARILDPISPTFSFHEASYLVHTNQADEAAARCLSIIQTHPDMPAAYFALADVRRAQQRFDEAIDARRRAHALRGDDDIELDEVLADASGAAGYARLEATAVRRLELRTLERRRAHGAYTSPLDFARAYAQLDEREQAFEYLTAALEAKSPGLVFLNVDRAWDPIRQDPVFKAAVKQVGLPPPSQ